MQAFYENKNSAFYCRDAEGHSLECQMHLHYNIEVAVIFEGLTDVYVDNAPRATATGGDVILVFPNQIHRFDTKYQEKHVLFIADPQLLSEFSSLFTEYLPRENIIKGAANDKDIILLCKKISELYFGTHTPYREAMLKGYLTAFLGKLFDLAEFKKINAEDIHAVGNVMNYCMAHYAEPLSLSLLEKRLHINKYYISHMMNSKLHMGFNDYVNSIRVSNACRMLTESNASISEISDAVGFNTVRTFNRAFSKRMGISPREYRRKSLPVAVGPGVENA